MLFSLFASALAFAATSFAAPASTELASRQYLGEAYVDVTQCVYRVQYLDIGSGPSPPLVSAYYGGRIMQYHRMWYNQLNIDMITTPKRMNTTDWITYTNGDAWFGPYGFSGSFEPTAGNPDPQLYVWGPKSPERVKLQTSRPDSTVDAKDNIFQDLCFARYTFASLESYLKGIHGDRSTVVYCKDSQTCPGFHSRTQGYWNIPGVA